MKQYKITAFSKDSEDFEMQITAPENLLFSDLHQAIQSALEFDPLQMASFFLCNNDWDKEAEIVLIDMEDKQDSVLMDEVKLGAKLSKQNQKLIYLFDFFSERGFFLNVDEISEEKKSSFSINVIGEIPMQISIDDEGVDDLINNMGGDAKKDAFKEFSDEFSEDYNDEFGDDNISFENIDDLEDY